MKKTMVIDRLADEVRAAVFDGTELTDFRVMQVSEGPQPGAIYLAKVQTVRRELEAAFVLIGDKEEAFLTEAPDGLRQGAFLPVQGTALPPPDSGKKFRVSAKIQIAGKLLVYQPGKQMISVSTKIHAADKKERLRALMQQHLEESEGVILRSASANAEDEAILTELSELRAQWEKMERRARYDSKPGLLSSDFYTDILFSELGCAVDEIVTNDPAACRYLTGQKEQALLPAHVGISLFSEEKGLLGDLWQLDQKIEELMHRKLWLPCGGFLIVDFCEAMTVYDVNSGKMVRGKDPEASALAVNLEAVREIARHIRLCDVGGIIVADLIDMRRQESRDAVLQEIRGLCAEDRAGVEISGISKLGLLEMTRKRKSRSLPQQMRTECRCCAGRGTVLNARANALQRLRNLRRQEISGKEKIHRFECSEEEREVLEKLVQKEYEFGAERLASGKWSVTLRSH